MSYVVLSFDILLNRTVADLTEQGGIFKKAKKPSSRQIHNLVRNSLAKYANHYVNRGASELAQIQYTYYGHTLQWDQPIGSRDGFAAWPMAIMGGSAFHGQKVFKASKDSDFEDDEIGSAIEGLKTIKSRYPEDDIVFLPPILNNIGILFFKQYSTSGVVVGTLSPPLANAKS